jgi:SAM-dependent methyltransferase
MKRVSTARTSPAGYLSTLFRRLPAGILLNVGAGDGRCSTPGQQVVHVDHVGPGVPGDVFVVADARALPFRSGAFDGVLMKDVLEHVDDSLSVLTEMRRVARERSRIIIQVPRAIPRAVWDDPTHVRGYTKKALVDSMTMTGWQPTTSPSRIGGFPGAGRLGLEPWLPQIMRIPVVGHWYGTNWLVDGVAKD